MDTPEHQRAAEILLGSKLFGATAEGVITGLAPSWSFEVWPESSRLDASEFLERFFILATGAVERLKLDPRTGREITINRLESGDGISVLTLLDGERQEAETRATADVEVLWAEVPRVRRWIYRHPSISVAFLKHLVARLDEVEHFAGDLVFTDTLTRLARLIVAHTTSQPPAWTDGHQHLPLAVSLSQEQMARMIGSVRVVVNRHLQELRRRGYIDLERGYVRVRQLERLRRLSEATMQRG